MEAGPASGGSFACDHLPAFFHLNLLAPPPCLFNDDDPSRRGRNLQTWCYPRGADDDVTSTSTGGDSSAAPRIEDSAEL
jgi:hypothetical protein